MNKDKLLLERVATIIRQRMDDGWPSGMIAQDVIDYFHTRSPSIADGEGVAESAQLSTLLERVRIATDALTDIHKLAADDHWSPPNQCWAIMKRADEALVSLNVR